MASTCQREVSTPGGNLGLKGTTEVKESSKWLQSFISKLHTWHRNFYELVPAPLVSTQQWVLDKGVG